MRLYGHTWICGHVNPVLLPLRNSWQVLCTTPSAVVDWLAITLAMSLSSCLLLVNVYPVVSEHAVASSKLLAIALVGSQIAFGLSMKLYFFLKM